jgi:hypothetical protein
MTNRTREIANSIIADAIDSAAIVPDVEPTTTHTPKTLHDETLRMWPILMRHCYGDDTLVITVCAAILADHYSTLYLDGRQDWSKEMLQSDIGRIFDVMKNHHDRTVK